MTPAARHQAAIEILDRILAGVPAEKALTSWARGARYAGSGDRAAVRDLVFDAVRRLRSDAALGGARSGRGLVLGGLRRQGHSPDQIFSGVRHGPMPLSRPEAEAGCEPVEPAERLDMPDWLWPRLVDGLGEAGAVAYARASQSRAPVHLRVNTARVARDAARSRLADEGIETAPHPAAATALAVTAGARRIRGSTCYADGLVELQDAASQAVVEALPLAQDMRILDYCAGGGGKTLALAAASGATVFAHDADRGRMADLPARAARAGARVTLLPEGGAAEVGPFDLVLCDAPCSGSGAWRRSPEGKWRLDPAGLERLQNIQAEILDEAAGLVAPGGVLAYATCSVLVEENENRIEGFLATHPDWRCTFSRRWTLREETDGFYTAHLTREPDCETQL